MYGCTLMREDEPHNVNVGTVRKAEYDGVRHVFLLGYGEQVGRSERHRLRYALDAVQNGFAASRLACVRRDADIAQQPVVELGERPALAAALEPHADGTAPNVQSASRGPRKTVGECVP